MRKKNDNNLIHGYILRFFFYSTEFKTTCMNWLQQKIFKINQQTVYYTQPTTHTHTQLQNKTK